MSTSRPTHRGTAVITGASSGIGKVYAERLAERGHDVVLVARREDRLQKIAADLRARFSVRADVLAADLSTATGVAAVANRISSDPVMSIMVNNAGFSIFKPLVDTPDEVILSMIALNITALTTLSKAALVAFKAKGSGALVNIGSGAGFASFPGIPIYGATKAYVYLFTQSLQAEVKDSGVHVQLVLPGAVLSEGWDVAGGADLEPLPESVVMTAEDCVDAALNGLDQNESVTAPSLHNETLFRDFDATSASLLQNMFDANPASRYGLSR